MSQDDESKEVPLSKEGAELNRLVPNGIRDAELASCRELAETIRVELGLSDPLSTGARIALLRAVLTGVVGDARQRALAAKAEFTHKASGDQEAFQVAAAGELIRIADPEHTFEEIRDYRYASKHLPGADPQDVGDSSPLEAAKLRAALWLGATSPRTAERVRPKMLNALAIAIAKYAHEQRGRLIAILSTADPAESDGLILSEEPPAPVETDGETPAEPASRRRWYLWAAAALVVIAGLVGGGIALFNNDEPRVSGTGSSPGSSASTGGGPTPSLAGQDVINQVERCNSLLRDSQSAKELRSRRQVVVDGRCYPDPSVDVGVQAGPTRDSADLGIVSTGQILNNVCLKSGQVTSDQVGTKTPVWVRFDLDAKSQAYISAIWTQGEEGADPC